MTDETEGAETPLEAIASLPQEAAARLRASWVTSVEQLVAIASTAGGTAALSDQVGMSEEAIRGVIDEARGLLPADRLAALDRPAEDDYGLGALRPPADEGSPGPR